MFSECVTVETGGTKPSRRFSSAVQGHFRPLENGEVQKCQNDIKAERADLRMIDLNLFRVFDAMMVHRSVRDASQVLSVTPSAVSHALSRLRQSIGDELFIPTESGMEPTERAPAVEIEMLWVERADQDEGLQWLLNELADSIGDLG